MPPCAADRGEGTAAVSSASSLLLKFLSEQTSQVTPPQGFDVQIARHTSAPGHFVEKPLYPILSENSVHLF
jgi:hypothetical protein